MRKIFKIILYILGTLVVLVMLIYAGYSVYFWSLNRTARKLIREKTIREENGISYRDLNDNGRIDIYEDPHQPVETRVEDLLSQMTMEEKVGMMWHPPIGVGKNGEVLGKPDAAAFFFGSTYDLLLTRKIKHFNLFTIPDPVHLAEWYNRLQKIAEQDRLGIPVTISTDPRHGINNFISSDLLGGAFSKWPEPIGLAATGDSSLVAEFGRIAAEEYRAVGIRAALHPMADVATEPRWARINGTFGEDAGLASRMTAAYIYGFQGEHLGPASVACMTKHWPGGGPQKNGDDAHFKYGMDQAYPGNNFNYHLIPFEAAFKAGTAMIMPYYGVPNGQTSEEVGMSFNREIITDLLRNQYGYDGVVCTDWGIIEGFGFLGIEMFEPTSWGVSDLSVKERIKKVIDAGVDQFGGNSNTEELLELVKEGNIREERIDQSVRRLLKVKFELGLFDDPYIDAGMAGQVVGKPEFVEKGQWAQRKSIVLLKNSRNSDSSHTLPLDKNLKIYVEHFDKKIAGQYATVVDSLEDADVALLHLETPWQPRSGNFIETMFHQGDLDFKSPELERLLSIMNEKPAIVCLYLDRAAVIPEVAETARGLLADFGADDSAVLDVVFGKFNPRGKLPIELPSSMEAVRSQMEDVPFDTKDPLFPFGFGLSY